MDPRWQRDSSNPKFVGVSGRTHADSQDLIRNANPLSTDGPLVTGAIAQDLESGEWLYYDGNAWKPVTTKEDLIRVEVVKLRQTLDARMVEMIALLQGAVEALHSIP